MNRGDESTLLIVFYFLMQALLNFAGVVFGPFVTKWISKKRKIEL